MIRELYLHLEANPGDWHIRNALMAYLRGSQAVPFSILYRRDLANLQRWFIQNQIHPTNNIWIYNEDEDGNEDPDLTHKFCIFDPSLERVRWSTTDPVLENPHSVITTTPKYAILPDDVVWAINKYASRQSFPLSSANLLDLETDLAVKMKIAGVFPKEPT